LRPSEHTAPEIPDRSPRFEVEHTEAWLFQTLQHQEEKKFVDPDDVYFEVRDREAERGKQGLSPRIEFLDTKPKTSPESKVAEPKNTG
ncbi:MAG TPA: hypothetical protein VK638_32365, partial [Edaphobacter sp.]|jgi:hypothetical protein|nr:hypothetical protein [Edaphobacter sp.]